MYSGKRTICFILLCLFFSVAPCTYAALLNTSLSQDKIGIDDTVTVTFRIDSTANVHPNFTPFEKDFYILGTNQSIEMSMINGVTHAQTVWQVTLEPKKAGQLTIPEIQFGDMKSTSDTLTVTEAEASMRDTEKTSAVFVEASVNNKTPFVDGQVLYTFKLFYNTHLENPSIEPPNMKDVILMQAGNDKSYQTSIKGQQYFVYEKNFALFPKKAGTLTIPALHFHALQLDQQRNFLNDPFSVMTTQPLTLATPSILLNVQKIPENFLGKEWLPANNITITEKWSDDPAHWEVGNPITRTVTVTAEGLLAEQLPDLVFNHPQDVNTYTDPVRRSNDLHGNQIRGIWEQKVTYIPNTSQAFTIPAIELPWWNIKSNMNAVAKLNSTYIQPIVLHAHEQSSGLQAMQDIQKSSLPLESKEGKQPVTNSLVDVDIAHISIWFWIALTIFIIYMIHLWRLRQRKLNDAKKETATTSNKNKHKVPSLQFTEKALRQACEEGHALVAQQLLLLWAQQHFDEPLRSLGQLREKVSNQPFREALVGLEQVLYGSKKNQWDGQALLNAYQAQKYQKSDSFQKNQSSNSPLPPLNPS